MPTSWTRLAAVLITAGLAAGCYESEVPLDPAPLADFDAGLAGAWRCLPVDGEPDEPAATLTVAHGQAARTFDATWEALRRRRDDPALLTGGAVCARVRR